MIKDIDTTYIPLNTKTLKSGQRFGPYNYSINEPSHKKHIGYLKKGNNHLYNFRQDYLFPFELYSFPRVMAINGGFKRINEIISMQGRRTLHKKATIDEELTGYVYLKKIFVHREIVYGYFLSETFNSSKQLIMTSYDTAVLLNETNINNFKRIVRQKINLDKQLLINNNIYKINTLELFFRYNWDDTVWINNIHTDSYASTLGYEKGLIEAPCLIDLLLANKVTGKFLQEGVDLSWVYYMPLYSGVKANVFIEDKENHSVIYLCTQQNHIIMELKIKHYEK